jgi:hypothetical protein
MSLCRKNIALFDERVTVIFLAAAVQRNGGSIAGNTVWPYIK